jgi:SulP family sulfate permease
LAVIANGALAVAFLSLLESSSIAKTLAAQSGDRVDLNQQMLSMGTANFACAFGGGMAVSGSLTRSVLNFKSGAQTAMSSVFSGLLIVAGLFLLGRFIGYIPKPALAMLVILVGFSLINRATIQVMLKTTRSDATVFLTTLIGGLFLPLDTAIYLGAAASIGLFLHKASRPGLKEVSFDDQGALVEQSLEEARKKRSEIAIVHVEGDLFFASSDVFLDQMRHVVQHPALSIIILRLRNAHNLDASVALTIRDLVEFTRANGRDVIVSGAHPEVERIFRQSGLLDVLTERNFFRYHPENPTISTRDALKRAQEITGEKSSNITIFAAEKKEV